MEPENVVRRIPTPAITDADREHAVELLQRACGEGRMTLEEFSVRAGAAWAADTTAELAEVTHDLAAPPLVGTTQPVTEISAIFSEHKQTGRWRLPRRLSVRAVFGSTKLDLREATIGADAVADGVVDIDVKVRFGEVKVTVPEGVEVELHGRAMFGSRHLSLAAVPRRQGTPLVRIQCSVAFGELKVRSARLGNGTKLTRWLQDLID
ncbi:MAG: DUF1707 domain-containing protein [Actinocatenispora sp.]